MQNHDIPEQQNFLFFRIFKNIFSGELTKNFKNRGGTKVFSGGHNHLGGGGIAPFTPS